MVIYTNFSFICSFRREEKKRKEREKKNRIRREQDSEELDKFIIFDTSWIQNDKKEISNKDQIIFRDNINYDVNEDIEKKFQI